MQKSIGSALSLLIMLLSTFSPLVNISNGAILEPPWWNKDWKFREKIEISKAIDVQLLRNHPIDIRIKFNNKCWTKSEEETSVRICQWTGNKWKEIESQIYDLKFSQENFIEECNVVFLIPEKIDGNELYYIYYDENEKPKSEYQDHIEVEEKFLYQEPIPGRKIDVKFYAIKEDNYYVYYIAQEGQLLGQTLSQSVVKLIDKTEKITPNTLEQLAQFCYSYYYGPTDDYFSSTSQKLVSKKIDIDGNLMARIVITSQSYKGEIITKNVYRYYYSPTSDKRIFVNVRHEVLEDLNLPECVEYWDGSYANILSFRAKSNAIKELNFGDIPSYLHIYGEDNTIKEFKLNKNPGKLSLILTTEDDIDLGKEAWISVDESNKAHAIILSSNEGIVHKGEGENDGVQIKGFQIELVNVPGLEADFTQIHLMRNSYENNFYDKKIPKNLFIEFDAEFFTSSEGYEGVRKETKVFQYLAGLNYKFDKNKETKNDSETSKEFKLTVFVHAAPSFPLGNFLSVLTGKNLSYIYAELWNGRELVSAGVASRVRMYPNVNTDYGNATIILQKFKMYLSMLDLRNISKFKKIVFDKIPEGKYVLKIYRENPILTENREIIGIEIVDLKRDTIKHVYCSKEKKIDVKILDQNKRGLENAKVKILLENCSVTEHLTDKNGTVSIGLPYKDNQPYQIKVFYNGIKVYEENFKFKKLQLRAKEFSININLSSIKFRITDSLGLSPGVNLTSLLRCLECEEVEIIKPSKIEDNIYTFDNLPPSTYEFEINYKKFKLQKKIQIPTDKEIIDIEFPATFNVKVNVFDSFGFPVSKTSLLISRDKKSIEAETDNEGSIILSIPPGEYILKAFDNEIKVTITGDEEIDFVTENTPFALIYITLAIICISLSLTLLFLFRIISSKSFVKLVPIILLTVALAAPWWQLSGASIDGSIKEEIDMYPLSQKFVSKIKIDSHTYLTISKVPDIVELFLMLVLFLTVICILFIFLSLLFEIFKRNKLDKILTYSGIFLLIFVISVFIYGANQLSSIGVGSICGSGTISTNLPYTSDYVNINASWYPSLGFYLCLVSVLILILQSILIKKMHKSD